MKRVILHLLKFNISMGIFLALYVGLMFLVTPKYRNPNPLLMIGFFVILIWILVGNIVAIFKGRREIIEGVKDGGVEIAAVALEVKENTSNRIKKRVQERAEARLKEKLKDED